MNHIAYNASRLSVLISWCVLVLSSACDDHVAGPPDEIGQSSLSSDLGQTTCSEDGHCPLDEVCELSTGLCRQASYYGATPPWGMSLEFDDPQFPEKGKADKDNSSSGPGASLSPRGVSETPPPVIEEGSEVCVDEHTEVVLYMSADDSNSKASPVIARKLINQGYAVNDHLIRSYEFLNYYPLVYAAALPGDVNIVPQMVTNGAVPGTYLLQVGIQGPHISNAERRPLNLTFSLDTSGSMIGEPLENLKAVMRASAKNFREGDVVSIVIWSDEQATLLNSHRVTGADDGIFLNIVDNMETSGSTDLDSGLRTAYQLAEKNFNEEYLNRVVLISDGQANVGVTEAGIIAEAAEDSESEGIYLVGVGTGNGYDDSMMDEITDAGKGAYLFIDSPAEATKQFTGDLFLANLEIAAMNVRLRLKLPSTFRVVEFHGEEMSADPQAVKPQHLAPNTAMVYHQAIGSCTREPFRDDDVIEVQVEFQDPRSRQERLKSVQANGKELLGDEESVSDRGQLVKGNAVVTYAEALKKLYHANREESIEICERAQSIVDNAAASLEADPDLDEVTELLSQYCVRCVAGNCGPDLWGTGNESDETGDYDGDDDDDDYAPGMDNEENSTGCACRAVSTKTRANSLFVFLFNLF